MARIRPANMIYIMLQTCQKVFNGSVTQNLLIFSPPESNLRDGNYQGKGLVVIERV